MGCSDGFDITLYPNEGWPPGAYRFVITRDGTSTTTCDGTLPLKSCRESSVTCDGEGARVGASGCALPAAEQSFYNIGFDGYPKVVDIDVLRDGVPLTRAHYDVTYTVNYPNGPECGLACCWAPPGALTLPKRK
jgi:hypothetical protein